MKRRSLILFLAKRCPTDEVEKPARKQLQALLGPDCVDLVPVSMGSNSAAAATYSKCLVAKFSDPKAVVAALQSTFGLHIYGNHLNVVSADNFLRQPPTSTEQPGLLVHAAKSGATGSKVSLTRSD